MAFTAAVVVRRGGWAKCMLISAVVLLGATVEAYNEQHSVGRPDTETISAGYVEAPPEESMMKVDEEVQLAADHKRASSFRKRYLVIATLLLVAIGVLFLKGEELEAKAQKAKLQKEKAQEETAQKDKILVDILNSFIGKLIDAEHHIGDDVDDFKDRLRHIDDDIEKFRTEIRHEFRDIRDLIHKLQDALSNKKYDEVAALLKEESDQETLVNEENEDIVELHDHQMRDHQMHHRRQVEDEIDHQFEYELHGEETK